MLGRGDDNYLADHPLCFFDGALKFSYFIMHYFIFDREKLPRKHMFISSLSTVFRLSQDDHYIVVHCSCACVEY